MTVNTPARGGSRLGSSLHSKHIDTYMAGIPFEMMFRSGKKTGGGWPTCGSLSLGNLRNENEFESKMCRKCDSGAHEESGSANLKIDPLTQIDNSKTKTAAELSNVVDFFYRGCGGFDEAYF